jgi:para-aminobenzoate synthetase/4-amino-4-deoxychorismate lyase
VSRDIEELISTESEDAPQTRFKVRVLAEPSGMLTVEYAPIPPVSCLPVKFDISTCSAEEATPYPAHKTTLRSVFNQELERALSEGLYDTVFVSTRGEVTEGTINSVFIDYGDGPLLTPVLESGLLPGTLRAELLARGLAAEALIDVRTLRNAQGIYLGNSVRGLVPAVLADRRPAC